MAIATAETWDSASISRREGFTFSPLAGIIAGLIASTNEILSGCARGGAFGQNIHQFFVGHFYQPLHNLLDISGRAS